MARKDEPNMKEHRTIFTDLLEGNLSESERSVENMAGEAQLLFIAGTVTTSHTLGVMTYHLLTNPNILSRVRDELVKVMPQSSFEQPSLQKLEALPYFVSNLIAQSSCPLILKKSNLLNKTACIQESIRLSYGVAGRKTRVSRQPIQYRDWVIPAGAPVSMSIPFMHRDETAFQDAMTFRPERWLVAQDRERLDGYFSSFSKGPRACLGM